MPPVRFDRFQHDALYGPRGFYQRGGAAGIERDFVTAVEASPLFAEAVLTELETVWRRAGEPGTFTVAEGGSGVGTLALHCMAGSSDVASALRWVMIEVSQDQRDVATERLDRAGLLAEDRVTYATDIRQIADGDGVDFIVANELLDNLAVRVVRKDTDDRFSELYVDPSYPTDEHWAPLEGDDLKRAMHHGRLVDPGAEFPLADRAVAWVWTATKAIRPGGQMTLFDYGATTVELSRRPDRGWLRFYRGQSRRTVADAVDGGVDITSDVPFDQLPGWPQLDRQGEWLEYRVPALRDAVAFGDVAIVDRHGMGGFTAATWSRPA